MTSTFSERLPSTCRRARGRSASHDAEATCGNTTRASVGRGGRLDAAQEEVAAAKEQVAHKDRILEITHGNTRTYQAEWEGLLAKPKAGGRGALGRTIGVCASVPLTTVEPGDDLILGAGGCWGWRL